MSGLPELPGTGWGLTLVLLVLVAYALVGVMKAAFRGLGRVAAQSITQREDVGNSDFLRKSLHHPTPLWFSLQIASVICLSSLAGLASMVLVGLMGLGPGSAVLVAVGGVLLAALLLEFTLPPLLVREREEGTVLLLLPLLKMLHYLLLPLSALLARTVGGALLGERLEGAEPAEPADEEEIAAFIEMGEHEGILEEREKMLIRGVVEFGDAVVREVMTPRTDVVAVSFGTRVREVRRIMAEARHTRLPVYEDNVDSVRGIAHTKDILGMSSEEEEQTVEEILRPVFYAPETMKVHDLLLVFQEKGLSMAVVVDEYGGTAGIVTVEDLVEEIVGEISDEHEVREEWIQRDKEGRVVVDGRAELDDLSRALGLDLNSEEVETVGGLVFATLGRVPEAGEVMDLGPLQFHVLSADEKRIHRLRIEGCPETEGGEEEERVEREAE